MPRVAFFLPDFRIGGAEKVALTLIQALVERGVEVDLVLLRGEGELLDQLPAGVTLFPLEVGRIRDSLRPFADYLQARRPDAVQVSMWPLTLVPMIARRMSGYPTRVVVSDHGILSEGYAEHGLLHRLFLRASIALLYPLADARVTVSEGVAGDIARLGRLQRETITILHNPIAPRAGNDVPKADWGGEGKRVLAVGSLKPVKNYPLLLNAFARLIGSRPARLIILGEGQQRAELESLAAELGIADYVAMPGAVADPSPYYASADVMVLSSDAEGFGNVLVEAMQHGLTAVSTDCPTGPREILDGGRYGYLIPCGETEALASAMSKACDEPFPPDHLRERAEKLSGAHVIDRYQAMLLPGWVR